MADTPHAEYSRRLAARREAARRHDRSYRRVAWGRLGTALAFLALVWVTLSLEALSPWWLLAPPFAFVGLMVLHSRIDRERKQAAEAVRFYEQGIARIEDRWTGNGESGSEFLDPDHLYAADLDLFGRGSVFELLSICRTKAGERILADWLRGPSPRDEILARQEAVDDLRERLDLREDLSTLGSGLKSAIHLDRISSWANGPVVLTARWLPAAVLAAPLVVLAALVYAIVSGMPWVFYGCLVVQAALVVSFRGPAREVLDAVDGPQRELDLVSALIARVEEETFRSPRLAGLRATFEGRWGRTSTEIRRLVDVVERQRSLKSADAAITIIVLLVAFLVAPFSVIVMLDVRTALAVERWRQRHGTEVGRWILSIGEIESLMSLAGYAYEHPEDPFPEITGDDGPVFVGEMLGHPLLPARISVPNSVALGRSPRMLMVSGSNMSGKSTLLRTVGVSAVMALAGAPVRAARLRLSPLRIGATLRVQDSLQAGTSRFYAEIVRIRDIMKQTSGPLPVLFLLDEVLHGTNSHDRAIGSEAIVRGLVSGGAIGLVTTHDLVLAGSAERMGELAMNVHFEDRVENGKMVFDYRMKTGVIKKSNALDLMRAVGIDV
jgi:FtsH-binding integral membrane protein